MHKTLLSLVIALAVATGCALTGPSGPQTYEDASFSFQYPENWQTMAELWGDRYHSGKEYYQLGVTEIIMVTSVIKQGESGIWFAVASRPLAGTTSLESITGETYLPFMDSLQDYAQARITLAGLDGFEVTYRRPWGEPWWQFRDIWLEKDGTVYLLSFHAGSLDRFRAEIDSILASFTFK